MYKYVNIVNIMNNLNHSNWVNFISVGSEIIKVRVLLNYINISN